MAQHPSSAPRSSLLPVLSATAIIWTFLPTIPPYPPIMRRLLPWSLATPIEVKHPARDPLHQRNESASPWAPARPPAVPNHRLALLLPFQLLPRGPKTVRGS